MAHPSRDMFRARVCDSSVHLRVIIVSTVNVIPVSTVLCDSCEHALCDSCEHVLCDSCVHCLCDSCEHLRATTCHKTMDNKQKRSVNTQRSGSPYSRLPGQSMFRHRSPWKSRVSQKLRTTVRTYMLQATLCVTMRPTKTAREQRDGCKVFICRPSGPRARIAPKMSPPLL